MAITKVFVTLHITKQEDDMQYELEIYPENYSEQIVLIGLSGGINSAAVLCWLAQYPEEQKPKTLHLFYAHFKEHSPDTEQFVHDCLEFAKRNFDTVIYKQTNNSIIDFFREQKMIPHPMSAPCTRLLKILPMLEYAKDNGCDIDLVGYVKEEKRRINRMYKKNPETKKTKGFPISSKSNEWCFELVKKEVGWYPKIYDIRDAGGNRIFAHNNCLPCKNMQIKDFEQVKIYYPEYWQQAVDLSNELKKYWGRDKDQFVDAFMVSFGREEWEVGYEKQSCEECRFD